MCTTRTVSRPMSGNVFANACRNFHLPKMLCYILLVAISFAVSVPTYMTAGLAEGQAKSAPLSDSEVSEGAIQLYHAQRLVHQATNMLEKRSFCTQCRDDTVRSALLKIKSSRKKTLFLHTLTDLGWQEIPLFFLILSKTFYKGSLC